METLFDTHTLYVLSGKFDTHEIHSSIKNALIEYDKKYSDIKIIVNTIKNNGLTPIGISYVFLSDSSAYYILTGKNDDGSERVIIQLDDNPDDYYDFDETIWDIPYEQRRIKCWADTVDEEERYRQKKEVKLPPLISPYIVDDSGKKCYIDIKGAFVEKNEDYVMNTIKIKNVPNSITCENLKSVFKEYSTTIEPIKRKTKSKNPNVESYPIVTITSNRRGYVTFSSRNSDAAFALLMTKRICVKNHVLQCSHPLVKER